MARCVRVVSGLLGGFGLDVRGCCAGDAHAHSRVSLPTLSILFPNQHPHSEERYRSCGYREELHAIKRTLDALHHFGGPTGKGGGGGGGGGGGLSANSRKQQPAAAAAGAGAGATQQQEGKENAGGFIPMPPPPQSGGRGAGPRRRGLFTVLTEQDEDEQATLPNPRGVNLGSEAAEEEVARLRRERDMLLSSGNYDVDDPIIQELTKLIRERGGANEEGGGVPGGVVSQASTTTFSAENGEQGPAMGVSGGAGAAAAGASVSS